MAGTFDPYYQWLGIQPKDQPPHYYRLLGIELFEPDEGVIERAADRQMAHLKQYSTSTHASLAQQLLNEISGARVCLLNRSRRDEYDAGLRKKIAAAMPAQGERTATEQLPVGASVAPFPAIPRTRPVETPRPQPVRSAPLHYSPPQLDLGPQHVPSAARQRKNSRSTGLIAALGAAALLLFGGLAAFWLRSGSKPSDTRVAVAGAKTNAERKVREKQRPTEGGRRPIANTPSTAALETPQPPAANSTEIAVEPADKLPVAADTPATPSNETSPSPEATKPDSAIDFSASDVPDLPDAEPAAQDDAVTADTLVLVNSYHGGYNNAGTRRCNILLLRNDEPVWVKRDIEVPWKPNTDERLSLQLPAEPFDTVRVEVTALAGLAAALTEVEVLSKGRNLARGAHVVGTPGWQNSDAVSSATLVDGITSSAQLNVGYWLAASGLQPWAEICLRRPKASVKADRIVIWNQNNRSEGNRGTEECNVVLLDGPREVWRRDALEVPWTPTVSESLTVPLPEVSFGRVRVEVTKVRHIGGGLGEVEVWRGDRNLAKGAAAFASSYYPDPRFAPARIVDGIASSDPNVFGHWLLPDGLTGWVELELAPDRKNRQSKPFSPRADRIVLWNQHNGPHNDRAADLCNVILFDGEREVWRRDHVRLPSRVRDPSLKDEDEFAAVLLPKVKWNRIRVEQAWWLGAGGGLGEVEIFRQGENVSRLAAIKASGQYSEQFAVEQIRDGNKSHIDYWLLPDNTPGWVEFDFGTQR